MGIRRWEEAIALLASTASRVCELSVALETQCASIDRTSSDLVTRIGSSFDLLQDTIDQQLTQARLAVARARNRLYPPILTLPGEILSLIFMNVVYDPLKEGDIFPIKRPMQNRVELIYQRLYSIMGVCATWRNVGLTCRGVWSVIPLVDPKIGRQRISPAELGLQRAGDKNLHLAVSLPHGSYRRLDVLAGHWHKFKTINVESHSTSIYDIYDVLFNILEWGSDRPIVMSNLSIRSKDTPHLGHHPESTLGCGYSYRPALYKLLGSLSTLRVDRIRIDWALATFTHRLVGLRLGDLTFSNNKEVLVHFKALSSAHELRDLKVVNLSVEDPYEDDTIIPLGALNLPALTDFYLGGLTFHPMTLFLAATTPESCRLALSLTYAIHQIAPGCELDITEGEILSLFRTVKVYKLIISGGADNSGFWASTKGLRALLKSVPALKILVVNWYDIQCQGILGAFRQPSQSRSQPFPKLVALEFYATKFSRLGDLRTELERVVSNHPIQKMVLAGQFSHSEGNGDVAGLVGS